MLNTKAILGFLVRFIAWFVLLMYVPLWVPWLGVDRLYAKVMVAEGNFFFGRFGTDGRIKFAPADPEKSRGDDLRITWTNENVRDRPLSRTNRTRTLGYWPTGYLLALILASPVPWKRRGIAFLWGLLLSQIFVCFRLFILILFPFANPVEGNWLRIFEVGDLGFWIIGKLDWVFVKSFAGSFVMPLLIWFPLCFRLSDWQTEEPAVPPTE